MNLSYVIPQKEELDYRKKLLSDPKTMEYNKEYGGTIDFKKEKWDAWYSKWIKSDNHNYYYAYIKDNKINKYIGEIAYHKDPDTECAMLNIIIEHKYRGHGYSTNSLKKLIKTAFINGYTEVRDTIAIDNITAQKIFKKFGFHKANNQSQEYIDFRMTIKEYEKLYGKIKNNNKLFFKKIM